MSLDKFSNIFGLVLFSLLILSSISVFLGHMCTNLLTHGFLAYVLNIFACPLTMLFHLFVGWSGDLTAIYFLVAFFFAIGIGGLLIVILDMQTGNTKFSLRITRYVFGLLLAVIAILLIIALCVLGFNVLHDASVWSGSWIVIFIALSISGFIVRTILLHQKRLEQ